MPMEKLNTSSNESATSWLSNLLLDEGCNFFEQCQQNLFGDDEFLSHDIASVLQQDDNLQQQPLSSESYNSYPLERPNKKSKTKTIFQDVSPVSSPSSITSQILSFEKSNSLSPTNNTSTYFHGFDCTLNTQKNNVVSLSQMEHPKKPKGSLQKKNLVENINQQGQGTKRSFSNAQDHIIAERKRREKLSQCLIALAALIPGLKKMDKASVLGDAIKYVKELQERLRVLEERNKNNYVESVVTVNKPQLSCESSSDDSGNYESLPHVEARVLDKDVLLRIHCKKQKGFLLKILMEIHNLHLSVVNSSVLPFGDSILDITIVAQMGMGYNFTKNDLVKSLHVAALRSMS